MKRSIIVFACLTAILFSITSCEKDAAPTPPPSGDTTWVLTGTKSYTYDISTGEIDDSTITEIKYQSNPRQIVIYDDGEEYEKFTYTSDGLLSTMSEYDGAWIQTGKFNRNGSNELQSLEYLNDGVPGIGYFKTTANTSGKTIQYIDTADGRHDREYFTVQFDNTGKVTGKKYEESADGFPYSDFPNFWGNHNYTYDSNNNLLTVLGGEASADYYDSTWVTYIRDSKGNDLLLNYFKNLYGNDLYFWFSKYKIFNDNLLSNNDGVEESYYNFGKPCTKITVQEKWHNNGSIPATGTRTIETIYNNVYDANGNLVSYTGAINGKITEKWVFTYSKP